MHQSGFVAQSRFTHVYVLDRHPYRLLQISEGWVNITHASHRFRSGIYLDVHHVNNSLVVERQNTL